MHYIVFPLTHRRLTLAGSARVTYAATIRERFGLSGRASCTNTYGYISHGKGKTLIEGAKNVMLRRIFKTFKP